MRALASVLLLLAACAHTKTPDVYVQLEESGGLGSFPPSYTLTLYQDGAVEFEHYTQGRPDRRWRKIDPQRVAYIMQQAERVPEWSCDPSQIVYDVPTVIVTVSRHGVTRHFEIPDEGCPAPDAAHMVVTDLRLDGGVARFMNGR